ncbi:MAG: CbtA family protein [Gammaproteobacteria bacterium]|nr:CbtA family protein [Gammaproteobacteria bacterium]
MLFRRLVLYALLVGAVAGLVLTAVQFWQVIPIIQSAEVYEGEVAPPIQGGADHDHAGHDHEHDANAWTPQDGLERTGYTLLSNVLTAAGLGLVLLAAMVTAARSSTTTRIDWRHGLLWGASGYAVFWLSPALGLPPEIPGAAAASLEARQLWWLFAVVCSAAGLAGFAFGKSPWRWASLVLIVIPHLVGAPHPEVAMFADKPPEAAAELEKLARQFYGATAVANAVFWLVLGLTSTWAVRRIVMSNAIHD